jgi:IS5 family transposase
LYNLSDDQLDFQIVDRASFKRFLGLKKSDKVPDSRTFWLFREQLIKKDVILGLFKCFNETLDAAGVFANEGKMVDASFVEAPRQRNTREDQEKIYKKKEVISKVHEKGYRNKPLTETQKARNKEKSSIRVRVEHVFGFVENSMHGSIVRTISIARANAKIGMMNLTYNICRCTQLKIVVAMG